MSESNTRTVWFITGANRGIGLGLVRYILQENEHDVVFAGTRDPAKSNDLNELASEKEGRLFVLELSSESEEQAKAAAQVVKDKIGHVDVVIANAGIANYFGPVSTSPLHEYESHWRINTLGVVILFQALYPLLLASPTGGPKFVPISTGGASLTNLIPLPNGPYGSSKAALNFVTKRIAQEEEKNGLIAFPLTPGWVATDLGNHGAKAFGLDAAPLSLEDSVKGIISVIRSADMSTSGKFMGYDGKETAW